MEQPPTPEVRPRHPILLRAIDRLLPEVPRTADELRRARVIVGTVCVILLSLVGQCLHGWLNKLPPEKLLVAIIPGIGGALALGLVRRRRATTVPAIILCMSLWLSTGWTGLHRDGLVSMYLPWQACAVLLAVYLCGHGTASFLFLVASVLQPLVVFALHRRGIILDRYAFPPDPLPVFIGAGVTASILTWSLGWGYSRAADAAHGELSRALETLHESRAKLASLVDNTDDRICSLDHDLRLVTMNASFRSEFLSYTSREPQIGDPYIDPAASAADHELWRGRCEAVLRGDRIRTEQVLPYGERRRVLECSLNPIFGPDGGVIGITFFGRDITARKEAEEQAAQVQRQLLVISRKAGMAEVATSVLHNVGNVLNSVNVSASLVTDLTRRSKVTGLIKVVELLRQHDADLAGFFERDPRARRLPDYLAGLSTAIAGDRDQIITELDSLQKNIDHIKTIVSMQQSHAGTGGVIERLSLQELLDDGLRFNAVAHDRHRIEILREYEALELVEVDRHKIFQIVMNLLNNARQAVRDVAQGPRRIVLGLKRCSPGSIAIEVSDTGCGIAAENMVRIFSHGFTTKPDGHGFGLHASASAAKEMGGELSAYSAGVGQGATFTLRLPSGA